MLREHCQECVGGQLATSTENGNDSTRHRLSHVEELGPSGRYAGTDMFTSTRGSH